MKKITIAVKEPGKAWHTAEVFMDLEPNIYVPELNDIVMGTIFAVRSDEAGEFVSLTKEDEELFKGI